MPLSAFGDGVTLPEVKEAVGYLMDDVSNVQKEMQLLKKEVIELRKKISLLEKRLAERSKPTSKAELPLFFRKENYKGKLVFAGTFRSFSHALIRTQNLLELNLCPDVLLLHNGMFSVVLYLLSLEAVDHIVVGFSIYFVRYNSRCEIAYAFLRRLRQADDAIKKISYSADRMYVVNNACVVRPRLVITL